jgi:hypothetical protein
MTRRTGTFGITLGDWIFIIGVCIFLSLLDELNISIGTLILIAIAIYIIKLILFRLPPVLADNYKKFKKRRLFNNISKYKRQKSIDKIIIHLTKSKFYYRFPAAIALSELNDKDFGDHLIIHKIDLFNEVSNYLILVAKTNKDSDIQYEALTALGKLGTDLALKFLLAAYESGSKETRILLANILAQTNNSEAIDLLLNSLKTKLFLHVSQLQVAHGKCNN